MIPLAQPDITAAEIDAVVTTLKSNQLSLGPELSRFETAMAEYVGVKHCIAVNSGTSGLHLIIRALEIGAGDEVITTPFSFIASSNCLLFEGAKPVFVDVLGQNGNIDVDQIEAKITARTKAILAVDVFGYPAEWDQLEALARKHNLFLIEDSAEALGSEFRGRKCGSFGHAAIFGFYPNKQITTGEGGVVLTNDTYLANIIRSMSNQGRGYFDQKWLLHERLGYNYRLSEINCALGRVQLNRLEEIKQKRLAVTNYYINKLQTLSGVQPFPQNQLSDNSVNPFLFVVQVNDEYAGERRAAVINGMADFGIQCGYYFYPIHQQPYYKTLFSHAPEDFPIAHQLGRTTIALPFYNNLSDTKIDYIVSALNYCLAKN
ncbi:TPA: polysaccharide biosynthesis protein [Candidatus Falkowbacteria bacterium]|nr:polysaccharide biosynthesis protein [Candidatus Falkowbacteria bacterium]